ncbi:MAG: aminomethyl-transferring glycine dehydrogenase subunit GcvPA [Trueperaceae bacterium]|nr:aminomethyl-transferring glycine dehydrogenase subunit GcvPA [Trueperaceae bacterium]
MNYLPHTPDDIAMALRVIGVDSVDELFADMPKALRKPDMDLPSGMDETSLLEHLRGLAAKNKGGGSSLLGGGVRNHFIPSVTPHLALQSEFVTAYTPYQAEVAQGILQATFEYQTMMSELTGLPVSNASMYDGASSVAEAALLAVRQAKKHNKVLISSGVHPESREVAKTYLKPLGIEVVEIALDNMITPQPEVDDDVAGVIVQSPNFLGYIEPMADLANAAHDAGALFIAVCDPLSLAVLKAPGDYGADIAVGDGQTIGNPVAFGGPHFGYMVVSDDLLRQLPGRIVGETTDEEGKRAFVLTLQAREQHIRRSKAKSNICSNHQLAALMAAVNLSALGPQGLRDVATQSVHNAHSLAKQLAGAGLEDAGFKVEAEPNFFNEFVLRSPVPAKALRRALADAGVQAGVPVPSAYGLGNAVVLSATELTTQADIDALIAALQNVGQPAPKQVEVAYD